MKLMELIQRWQDYSIRRRIRRHLRQTLKDARHIRDMRLDMAHPGSLERLAAAETSAIEALTSNDTTAMQSAAGELALHARALTPPRPYAALRENIEVLVVAVAVAMAFRTYFVQPFKIPTSSMFPTLHGIHHAAATDPGLLDRWPFKIGKWIILGEWYTEVKAGTAGTTRIARHENNFYILVGETPHQIYENMSLHISPGQTVYQGQLLASGIRTAGDHIFVNRMIWHFRRPRRGEIMVFKTTGIEHPQIKKNEHYVKRMVGLPDETLRIEPPYLLINGEPVKNPPVMERIQTGQGDYHGYLDIGDFMESCNGQVELGTNDYFACGDNQRNSLDSRYWGPVDKANLVGPTFFVYWPISRRWGWAE